MRKLVIILNILTFLGNAAAQNDVEEIVEAWYKDNILVKDLDGDGIMDTVRLEYFIHPSQINEYWAIYDNYHICDTVSESHICLVCLLSSQQFEKMYSQILDFGFETLSLTARDYKVTATRNGFEYAFGQAYMGYHVQSAQFRYDNRVGKMQLIGMSHESTGNAEKDGRGKSSVNLLTGDHIGDWLMYEYNLDRLVKMPTIRTKMDFGKIYLEDFCGSTLADFYRQTDKLRYEQSRNIIETNLEKETRNE